MKFNSIYDGRKEILVAGDGNCFYRSISLWIDGNTDRRHDELRAMVNNVIELYPTSFEPFLFNTENVEAHLSQSKVLGTWAETLDIMACATLIRRKIFLYSKSTCKWLKFEPLFLQDINNKVPMPSSVARKKCTCPVTLTYNDFNPLSNHFNLLIPTGPCCECPEPKNNFETTTIHLDMDGLSHDHMPKDSDTLSKDCMSKNNRHTKNSKPTIKSRKKRQTGQNKTNVSKELLNGNKPVKNVRKNKLAQSLCAKNTTPNSKLQTNLTYEHEETKIRKNQTDINKTDVGSDCSISKQTEKKLNQSQTCMVNRTNGLKSNVRQSDNVDKIKMTMQQQTKQCEADKVSNNKSFSHKNQEKNVGKPTFLQEQVLKNERTVNKEQTDLNSCCCANKQTEKQSDFSIAKDVSDFNSMNVKQLKQLLQQN